MTPSEYDITVLDGNLIMCHVTCGQTIQPRLSVMLVELNRLAKYHETEGTCTEKKVPA